MAFLALSHLPHRKAGMEAVQEQPLAEEGIIQNRGQKSTDGQPLLLEMEGGHTRKGNPSKVLTIRMLRLNKTNLSLAGGKLDERGI